MYRRRTHKSVEHLDFILWDMLAVFLAFVIAYMLRHGISNPFEITEYRALAVFMVSIDLLISLFFDTMHDVMKRGYYVEFVQSLKQAASVLFCTVVYIFLLQSGEIFSRIAVVLIAVLHLLFGYLFRVIWKNAVPKEEVSILLIADENMLPQIEDKRFFIGAVLTNRDASGEELDGLPVVASLDNCTDYICREWIGEVYICPGRIGSIESVAQDGSFHEKVLQKPDSSADDSGEYRTGGNDPDITTGVTPLGKVIEDCREMFIPVHIQLSGIGGKSFIENINGVNVLTIAANTATPIQLMVKRTADIIGSLIGSIAAIVIILAVGWRIKKESPGPILFKQERIGKNGKRFTCYKIRTMKMNADEEKKKYMEQNRVNGLMFKLDWDPRVIGNKIVDGEKVTGIGEKLRSGSWDEWPQFFNVLLGQMSLVGTRPPTVDEWERYELHHRARMSMKPGITGLWQVSGRSDITDFEEVVKLDTEYIDNWTIGLDCRILWRTVRTVIRKDGAI